MMWRAAIFLAIFAALQGWYSTVARNTWIERLVIDEVTVKSAAALIQLIDPATGVQPVGSRLHAPGGGINIINGCEGVDVLFLMMAAMLVAPISLNARLMGIVLGICVVLTLNQARVIGLFYAYRLDRSLFDMLHGVVAPLMLIVAVSGYFLLWLNWHAPVEHDSTAEQ
ncbi:MAG: exosortase/archaeosortase family protein [Aquabacterium sp.]